MNEPQHRETFIALRARKQGFGIASQIASPKLILDARPIREPDAEYLREVRHLRWIRRRALQAEADHRNELLRWTIILAIGAFSVVVATATYLVVSGPVR